MVTAAEFLAESKRLAEETHPVEGLAGLMLYRGERLSNDEQERIATFARDVRTALPRMREALEAVLALHRRQGDLVFSCAHCSGEERGWISWPCATVERIESALAEEGEGDG